MVLDNLQKQLGDTSTPLKKLIEAITPIFGIRWDLQVIQRIGSKRLNDIMWSLRNSRLPQKEYARIGDLWRIGAATDGTFPTAWEAWRAILERFNLDDEFPLAKWLPIVDGCIKQGWKEPSELASADAMSFQAVATARSFDPVAIQLWKASVLVFADISEGSSLALKGASANAEQLISRLKATTWVASAVNKDVTKSLGKLRMPKDFPALGPAAKLNKLRLASTNKVKVRRFFRTASQRNSLIGIRHVFGSFASAIRCYYSFCELKGCQPFPVRSLTVIEWSSIFNPGATFANYLNYLRKACFS